MIDVKSSSSVSDLRVKAMASMSSSKFALARRARHVAAQQPRTNPGAARVIQIVTNPIPTSRMIGYIPLHREAAQRERDLTSSSFKLMKDYHEYGSSNGNWRTVSSQGKRFRLPPGCAPRKSQRISEAKAGRTI
jgi:hypothetical protein